LLSTDGLRPVVSRFLVAVVWALIDALGPRRAVWVEEENRHKTGESAYGLQRPQEFTESYKTALYPLSRIGNNGELALGFLGFYPRSKEYVFTIVKRHPKMWRRQYRNDFARAGRAPFVLWSTRLPSIGPVFCMVHCVFSLH
jgi:hypothetical protein